MRVAFVAAVAALVTMGGAAAQAPTDAPLPRRTLADMTFSVLPSDRSQGHCLTLGPGTIEVSAKLAGEPPDRSVQFSFYRARGGDEHLVMLDRPLTRGAVTLRGDTVGGIYCYSLLNTETPPPLASNSEIIALGQDVTLSMTFADGAQAALAPPSPSAQPAPPDREIITGVAGQSAVSRYGGSEPIRATVREMVVMRTLPPAKGQYDSFEARTALGKFAVVLVDVENIGAKPEGVVLGHYLRDSRGRVFNGDTNPADAKVKHAMLAVFPIDVRSDDFQPNLLVQRVFIYDVPSDATGFMLTSDAR